MFILIVTREQGSDTRYGIRKSLLPIVEALRKRGHRVEIFDKNQADSVRSNSIELWLEKMYLNILKYHFGTNGKMAWSILYERIVVGRRAAKYAAKHGVTHVHCHDPLLGYAYQLFSKFYRSTKCWGYKEPAFGRFAKRRIGIETDDKSLSFLQKLEHKAEINARWVIVPTKSAMNQMMEDMNIRRVPAHWHVVPNFVSVTLKSTSLVRKELGIIKDEKLLLAVGQLIPMRRFSLLLHAISLIPATNQPRVILLGEGPDKQELLNLAKKLNIAGGFEINTTEDIGEYLSAADVYASVSSTEAFGMANCEALLAGVPSVCTANGAVPEVLGNGAILTSSDPEEIANAILKLLTSEKEREKLVEKAASVTAKWPGLEEITTKVEQIFLGHETNLN